MVRYLLEGCRFPCVVELQNECCQKVATEGQKPLFVRETLLKPRFGNPCVFWETPLEQGRKGTLPNNGGPYSYVLTVLCFFLRGLSALHTFAFEALGSAWQRWHRGGCTAENATLKHRTTMMMKFVQNSTLFCCKMLAPAS